MIKDISIEELRTHCLEILSKTFLELRQDKVTEDDIVSLSLILADDLKRDFKNLELMDIKNAFIRGTRETDLFVVKPRTWYTWIKTYRNILWSAEYEVRTMNRDPKQVPYYKQSQKLLN
jgi:hypothetical protein|tara:strand:- start:133 stop:489 length:357 start_codon:yes stop_codon:yes gene_type:complete